MNILKKMDLEKPVKSSDSIVYNALPVIAHVKGSSVSEIIGILKENKEYDIYGERYSGMDILRLWRFFTETDASKYLKANLTKCTAISSGVPIIMLAYKHQHDIPYEKWRGDKFTQFMLPKGLRWLVGAGMEKAEGLDLAGLATKWPSATLREYAESFLTRNDVVSPMTAYTSGRTGDKEFDALPASFKRMLLQVWAYHPSVRHANMITDPCDWDSLIDPLYEVSGLTANDDPWDAILGSVKPPKKEDLPW